MQNGNDSYGRRAAAASSSSSSRPPVGSSVSSFPHGHMATASASSMMNSQMRIGQILDEQDHKRCSDGNQRALLAETLDHLRGLTKTLESDDWMFASNAAGKQGGGNSGSNLGHSNEQRW